MCILRNELLCGIIVKPARHFKKKTTHRSEVDFIYLIITFIMVISLFLSLYMFFFLEVINFFFFYGVIFVVYQEFLYSQTLQCHLHN